MSKTPILRSTAKDWRATGVIAAVCVAALAGAVLTADIGQAHLSQSTPPGGDSIEVLGSAPKRLTEAYSLDNELLQGQYRTLSAHGLTITAQDSKITATNADGSEAWSYTRENTPICSLSTGWDSVIATYRTGVGCGDTVAINAGTGQYAHTRSSINSDQVVPISSNDRVGTVSDQRLDLWRSDLVRTVEYGDVEAKQEPDFQPHEECTITSAQTRKENLVLTDICPDKPEQTWLRFLNATPEDSRKPEVSTNIAIDTEDVRLVSVGEESAAIYRSQPKPMVQSFNKKGELLSSTEVKAPEKAVPAGHPSVPMTTDLPHNMSWFDGKRLYLFSPDTLKIESIVEDAIGSPIAVGEQILVPVAKGIAVVDPSTGKSERTIPVNRGEYKGAVHLTLAGTIIVETRGDKAVGFKAV